MTTTSHNRDGRKVNCSVPVDPDPTEIMIDLLKDHLSPEAMVMVISALSVGHFGYEANEARDNAAKQVTWLTDRLLETVGIEEYNQMLEHLGL